MLNIKDLQDAFNKSYKFDELKEKSRKYIEKIVINCENNFLAEVFEEPQERDVFKKYEIEYSRTYLIINKCLDENPSFRIAFDFVNPSSGFSEYCYEIEYNILGEFLDEFFLKV